MISLPARTDFVRESKCIEGLRNILTPREITEFNRFMALEEITKEATR